MKNKVMIIDDDKEIHMLMGKQLEALYTVVCASSGKEALDILKTEPLPQLILLDITMPEMDGYEVLNRLKSDSLLRDIPVVFLTGMADESSELKGLNSDVVDYLKKPIAGKLLLARVQHYIDLYSEREMKGKLDMEMIDTLPEKLTERELDVAKLMAEFRSDREICDILFISMPYAKKLVAGVKEKLGLEKRGDIRRFLI
ncbi:MAG: response regulator [Lachnospiraceae bacterium]|nr:response regulator [Lachnospiraceae bacterium]MBQ8138487.1 response regulator [Lachnospiraceae bacterium]MBR6302599.1 response regulator [Lachnospiraceae bacterium]MBR6909353.1 response regulator [Lachnospiraceae bacterium]